MVISVQYIFLICLDCLTKHVLHIVRLKPLFAGASFNWACFPFSEIGELDKVFHEDWKMKERKLVSLSICAKYM